MVIVSFVRFAVRYHQKFEHFALRTMRLCLLMDLYLTHSLYQSDLLGVYLTMSGCDWNHNYVIEYILNIL